MVIRIDWLLFCPFHYSNLIILYFNFAQINLQRMANDINSHAIVLKEMPGKDVSITIVLVLQ